MKFLKQMSVIFAVYLVSVLISGLLPVTFPGSVIGMILLFLLLLSGVLKPKQVGDAGDFLVKNMAFLFIPTVVGIVEYVPVLLDNLAAFLIIIAVTTLVTFAAAAWTVTAVIRLQQKRKEGK